MAIAGNVKWYTTFIFLFKCEREKKSFRKKTYQWLGVRKKKEEKTPPKNYTKQKTKQKKQCLVEGVFFSVFKTDQNNS